MLQRWLFVTYAPDPKRPILDPSARYRCFNRAEDLRDLGQRAAVISQQRFERDPPLHFDVYVFHRPWYSQDFEGLLDHLRSRGRRLLADLDDPVFAAPPRTALPPPFPESSDPHAPSESSFLRALLCFDRVSVATRLLADWTAEVHPSAKIACFPSGLGASWIASADAAAPALESRGDAIALAAGHDLPVDHERLQSVASRLLARSPGLTLYPPEIVAALHPDAPTDTTPKKQAPSGRFTLARHCHSLLLAIADGRREAALPAVRALEAAWLGCRVVAPPLPDFVEYEAAGLVLSASTDEWIDVLATPPPTDRAPRATRARAHLQRTALSRIHTRRLLDWMEA